MDLVLIATFTIKFACPGRRVNATPSWTVLYVGIAVAALTYPLEGIIEIAYATLSFGFVLTFYLYPLIYSDLKKTPLPLALLGQEGIYCAPFSLLLASLVRVGGAGLRYLPHYFILCLGWLSDLVTKKGLARNS